MPCFEKTKFACKSNNDTSIDMTVGSICRKYIKATSCGAMVLSICSFDCPEKKMRPLSNFYAASVLALLCATSAAKEFRLKKTYDANNFFDSFDFLTV